MVRMTEVQLDACRLLKEGRNVKAEAVPGAGKTAMIVWACRVSPKPCLVLAYNTLLAKDVCKALKEEDLIDDV